MTAVITSVTVTVPPGVSVTVGVGKNALSPGIGIGNFAARFIVPEKLQKLVRILVTVALALPVPVSFRVTEDGTALMEKSAVQPDTGLGVPVTMKLRS